MKTKTKWTVAAILASLTVAALAAGFKCAACNGTGWRGQFECTQCGGDGKIGG